MRASIRSSIRSLAPAILVAALSSTAFAGTSRAPVGDPDLIVVAEPSRSDALSAPSGSVTLTYRVVEIFAGEPDSGSIVVRHDSLSADERQRLREGDRVIVLARRDPSADGRYVAPAPLRATPSAVAAFRKWSAPEDVRATRPVADVVAEVEHGARAEKSIPAAPPAAPAAAPARPAVEEETLAPRHEPEVAPIPLERHVVTELEPPPAAKPEPEVNALEPAPREHDPPLFIDAKVQPRPGPGLPPSPSEHALGPALRQRTDLRPPEPGRRR